MTPSGARRGREHLLAANEKIFIAPGEGVHLPVLDITHKVTAQSFGGAFTIIEVGLAPGEMIPPHTHTHEDECAFVLEGELTFDVGGEIVLAPAGSFVLKPRGVYHAFCNTGTGPNRHLEMHAPGEFEGYYDEYERIVESEMGRRGGERPASNWGSATGSSGTRSSSPGSGHASA
jgi:quercetin dioxygenase-like cupin family protein